MKTVAQLKQERAALVKEARELLASADKEERALNEDEQGAYDGLLAQVDELTADIERREKLMAYDIQVQAPAEQRTAPRPNADIGMNDREVQQYSVVRAIRAAMHGNWAEAPLEKEASDAHAQLVGKEPRSFFIPHDVMARERRDLTKAVPSAGGYVVDEELTLPMIELLRNRLALNSAGAMIMSGLVGDVAIPKQTGGATAYWVSENGALTESQQAIGQVLMRPKTLGAYTEYSRRLMLQASIDVERFVRDDIARVLQLEIDRAALYGSGAANQPLGVSNVTGIGAPGTGAATFAMLVGLETAVAVDNADIGRLAYITNATVRGTLKQTEKATNTAVYLWAAGGTPVNGYPAIVSNQVSGNDIFFGNWSDLIMGFWSGLDVLVNPYANDTSGAVRVVAFQDVDVAVRHPESFAKDATA